MPQAVRGKTCCTSHSEILGAAHNFHAAWRLWHVAFEGLRCLDIVFGNLRPAGSAETDT